MSDTSWKPGLGTVLFVIFLVMKLAGVITWSWWWVFAPFWIPLSLAVLGLILVACLETASRKRDDCG